MEHGHAPAPAWAAAAEHSWLGETLRSSLWLYPTVKTLHIVGLALLVGAIAAFNVRVVVRSAGLELGSWQRAVLPVARGLPPRRAHGPAIGSTQPCPAGGCSSPCCRFEARLRDIRASVCVSGGSGRVCLPAW